jgi:hypothetical protein
VRQAVLAHQLVHQAHQAVLARQQVHQAHQAVLARQLVHQAHQAVLARQPVPAWTQLPAHQPALAAALAQLLVRRLVVVRQVSFFPSNTPP